ncbi:helix-turn-helix domain-containing protein [Caenimonas sp. DR4.4]|uniref:Helix-turn-helix domain-containing protein n=2 Tax=Caenimonas aquaedulcis TaxID=2793270 RepID=A0A931MHN8_9BURK|nr:helix-turn-helix domain-containing protein [Caenimonas aquaedulcis]
MPTAWDDKAAFSERLRSALKRAPGAIQSAAQLAHEFNLRHDGESVSDQAAQKWITGKARPSPEKLETLAQMLGVTAYWLRNGSPPAPVRKLAGKKSSQATAAGRLSEPEAKLVSRLRTLSEHQVRLISELVEQLAVERELAGH